MGEAAIAAFEQARSQMDPKEFGTELLSAAEQTDPAAVQEFKAALQNLNLPPEIIDALNQMIDLILANPQDYDQIRKALIAEGVPEDLLPANFDPSFFGALNLALDQMAGSTMPMGTQQFANGGIVSLKPIAKFLAEQGRNGDTMLAHITPAEARLLRRYGGSGTINPVTGLPEFFLKKLGKAIAGGVASVGKAVGGAFKAVGKAVSGVVKSVASAVKKFASSTVGKIVTTVALGFFLGPAAANLLGVSSMVGTAAVGGFIGSAGSTLLAGGKLKDAIKAGAIGGLTAGAGAGIMGGANAFQAGSYVGPTTVAGQVESFINSLKSLGGAPGAPVDVTGQLSYTGQGEVLQGAGSTAGTAGFGAADVGAVPGYQFTATAPAPAAAAVPAGNVIPQPEFVATAPGAGLDVASAGPVGGVGPIPGSPVAQTPDEFLRAAEFRNFGQAPADVPVMRIGQVDTGGGLGMADRAFPTGGPTPEQVVGIPTPRGPVSLGPEPKSFIDRTLDYFSPSARKAAGVQDAISAASTAKQNAIQAGFSKETAERLAMEAYKSATPGMFGTYGPMVGAGFGAAYLGGAFNPTQPKPPGIVPRETGFDLYNRNPADYGVTPGGASTTYAPPSIIPGYGTTTYTGPVSGYGQMSAPFAPPQFRVRDLREYLPGFFTGGAVRKVLNSASIKRAIGEENPQVAASSNTPTTRSAVVSPEVDKFGRPAPAPIPLENLQPGIDSTLRGTVMLGNNPVFHGFGTFTPGGALVPAGLAALVDRRRFMGYGVPSQLRTAPSFIVRRPDQYLSRGLAALAPRQFNMGGFAAGGQMDQKFPRRTGQINGPGTETSDSIPAMLSDGEFVMTAKAVRGAGGGSRREGAKRMYQMMRKLERKA